MDRRERQNVTSGIGLFAIGLFVGWFFFSCGVQAHTPCGTYDIEQQPDCHYVQVVNPITGKLEQQYICI